MVEEEKEVGKDNIRDSGTGWEGDVIMRLSDVEEVIF